MVCCQRSRVHSWNADYCLFQIFSKRLSDTASGWKATFIEVIMMLNGHFGGSVTLSSSGQAFPSIVAQRMNTAMQKYSFPLNLSTFCHAVATNFNIFYWDFIIQINSKWCVIAKWKEKRCSVFKIPK
ncbi:hypothetical protein CHARACLAT_002180 [Characodon lateralis]|uniref:Uncharacterized protein n=1 Tax=Characodon lateralis TaxID=208331 RepID=A0ABU7ERF6_9TELE|nr:hypothetical protein [Characodon lateralis]